MLFEIINCRAGKLKIPAEHTSAGCMSIALLQINVGAPRVNSGDCTSVCCAAFSQSVLAVFKILTSKIWYEISGG